MPPATRLAAQRGKVFRLGSPECSGHIGADTREILFSLALPLRDCLVGGGRLFCGRTDGAAASGGRPL